MKSRLLIALVLFLVSGQFVRAQDCQMPKEVPLSKSVTPRDGYPIEADGFLPFGWSADGKFAYLIRRNHDPVGEHLAFFIQDMVTDSILESWEHDTFEKDYADPVQEGWKEHGEEICRLLDQYGIDRQKKFHLQKGNGFKFGKVEIKHMLQQVPSEENWSLISASLYVEKRGAGKKRIFHLEGEAAENSLIKSLKVLGMAKSPFEDRVVVVLESDEVGFEGWTDRTYLLVGCDLVKGFQ